MKKEAYRLPVSGNLSPQQVPTPLHLCDPNQVEAKVSKTEMLQHAMAAHRSKLKLVGAFTENACKEFSITCTECDKDWCCYQWVSAGVFEGLLIANAALARPPRSMQAIGEHSKEQAKILTEYIEYKRSFASCQDDWFNMKRPCCLLFDGRCAYYKLRPVTCSSHLVISPAEYCKGPTKQTVEGINNHKLTILVQQLDDIFVNNVFGIPNGVMMPGLASAIDAGFNLLASGKMK